MFEETKQSKERGDTALLLPGTDQPNATRIPHISLDDIFEKIGFGSYQFRLILILGLVAAAEGAQITIAVLSLTILQNQWGYDNTVQSVLISLNFIGVVVGGAISGFFADRYGRLRPVLIALTMITILNVVSGFAQSVVFFGTVRFLLGIFLGFCAPIAFTIVVENVPKEHRGKLVMIALSFLFVGQLVECLLAYVTLGNLITGDWRGFIFWSTTFLIMGLVVNYLYLDESARYELVMGHSEKGFEELNKMIKFNNIVTYPALTQEEKAGLKQWIANLSLEIGDNEVGNVHSLFKAEYKQITLVIWLGFFIVNFIYYGIILGLPYILQRVPELTKNVVVQPVANPTDLASLTVSVLVESISVIIAIFVIDAIPADRRKLLMFFYFLTALSSLGAVLSTSRTGFVLFTTLAKVFINVCACYYYLFTVEIYPTKYRATGLGIAASFGKLGTIAMPWICLPLTEVYLFGPFVLFVVLSLVACLSLFGLNIDTKGADLK